MLILLHVPADGRKATGLSIPRDDYVALPGCPDGQCMGKIKQAYGLGYDQASRTLARQGAPFGAARVQRQRDAGRLAEIAAVEQFLGGVHVDHFVEVTLVAFYELAQVVQPITVCVNNDTQDLRSSPRTPRRAARRSGPGRGPAQQLGQGMQTLTAVHRCILPEMVTGIVTCRRLASDAA